MYPYIAKSCDGKYHLFCGVCNCSNPFIQKISAGMTTTMYSIACGNHCSPKHTTNQICGIRDIKDIAERDAHTPDEMIQMIRDVCSSLELDSSQWFGV